ncbi:27197_t:CDS:2, partial [Racocetra persica]
KQIKKDLSISTRTLAAYLSSIDNDISYKTIERHLAIMGYVKNVSRKTPMLTNDQKRKRHWYKKDQQPIRLIPKDHTKIKVWGDFSVKGKSRLFCFTQIMNKKFYVEIVRKHLPEVKKMFGKHWRWKQDNDPKHTSKFAKAFLLEN